MESSSPSPSPDQGREQLQQQPPPPEFPVADPRKPPLTKKRRIRYCSVQSCPNQVAKWGVCIRHGAIRIRTICTIEGCTNQSITQAEGVCIRHGAIKIRRASNQRCSHPGCLNQVQNNGVCRRHGAKTYERKCKEEGCTNRGVKGGLCRRHYSASVRRESGGGREVERCVVNDDDGRKKDERGHDNIHEQQQNPSEESTNNDIAASKPPPTNRDYVSPTSMTHNNGMTYAAMMNLINVQAQFIAEKDRHIVQLQNTIDHLLAKDGNVNGNNANGNNAKVANQPEMLEL